ncbi:MAG: hypothetical protein HQ514_13910 [Rhodospirillales bacterium]|nr:hypothetical protein [Rhodospirillales bacterium]
MAVANRNFQGRRFCSIGIVLAGVVFISARGLALDLGLTPSQVLSLWNGINKSLLVVATVVSNDTDWHRYLSELQPETVHGKRPADVLEQLEAYRIKLDRLRRHERMAPTRKFIGDDAPVTPTVVYLNSGMVLNGQIEWLIRNTGRELMISPFYPTHDHVRQNISTPSDVYAMAKLANIRLARILARIDTQHRDIGSGGETP